MRGTRVGSRGPEAEVTGAAVGARVCFVFFLVFFLSLPRFRYTFQTFLSRFFFSFTVVSPSGV